MLSGAGIPAGGPWEDRHLEGRREAASPGVAGSTGRWQPTGQQESSVRSQTPGCPRGLPWNCGTDRWREFLQ